MYFFPYFYPHLKTFAKINVIDISLSFFHKDLKLQGIFKGAFKNEW